MPYPLWYCTPFGTDLGAWWDQELCKVCPANSRRFSVQVDRDGTIERVQAPGEPRRPGIKRKLPCGLGTVWTRSVSRACFAFDFVCLHILSGPAVHGPSAEIQIEELHSWFSLC